jgi:hypothetical protein
MALQASDINAAIIDQGVKNVLIQMLALIQGANGAPTATTTVAGTVKEAADVAATANTNGTAAGAGIVDVTATPTQATINANFTLVANQINSILTNMKAAGQMA